MSVVVTSVFLLFALIFLGFFIGKRKIVRQESIPDLSNLVLKVTMIRGTGAGSEDLWDRSLWGFC